MKNLTRIEIIEKQLKDAPKGLYKGNETKKEIIALYSSDIDKLNKVPDSIFFNHCFIRELTAKCEAKERKLIAEKIIKKASKIERHLYAPEMNAIYFKSGKTIKCPQITDFKSAIDYLANKLSLHQLQNINFNYH